MVKAERLSKRRLRTEMLNGFVLSHAEHYGCTHVGLHISFLNRRGTLDCMNHPGSRIRALRKARGWTQAKLAEEAGVDQSTVSDLERGGNTKATTMAALVKALGTTQRYVIDGGTEADLYESEVIALFRALSDDDRHHMLKLLRGLVSQSPKPRAFKSTK